MKKSILSFVFVLALATVASAAPRFGVIGEQAGGLGAFITDDMFNAQVTFSNTSDNASQKNEYSSIKVGANYKIALDSVTALTAGVNYLTTSGKKTGKNIEKDNTLAISAGFERALSSNIVLTTQADLYSQKEEDTTKTTNLFSNGRVGVAYLF